MNYLLCYIAAVNLVTFVVWAIDKLQARYDGWRVAEKSLFALAFMGGSLGALAAMYMLRHKVQKSRFRYGIPAIMVMEGAAAVVLYFRFFV